MVVWLASLLASYLALLDCLTGWLVDSLAGSMAARCIETLVGRTTGDAQGSRIRPGDRFAMHGTALSSPRGRRLCLRPRADRGNEAAEPLLPTIPDLKAQRAMRTVTTDRPNAETSLVHDAEISVVPRIAAM